MSETPDNPFESGTVESDSGPSAIEASPGDTATTAKGPASRLLDGDAPGPSVNELKEQYGLGTPWAILTRGGVRAAVGGGVPPLVEIIIGSVMGFMDLRERDNGMLESEPGESNDDTEEMFE